MRQTVTKTYPWGLTKSFLDWIKPLSVCHPLSVGSEQGFVLGPFPPLFPLCFLTNSMLTTCCFPVFSRDGYHLDFIQCQTDTSETASVPKHCLNWCFKNKKSTYISSSQTLKYVLYVLKYVCISTFNGCFFFFSEHCIGHSYPLSDWINIFLLWNTAKLMVMSP